MISQAKQRLVLGLGVGLAALLTQEPILKPNRSTQAFLQNGLQLNGLQLNGLNLNSIDGKTSKHNVFTFNGTAENPSTRADWIHPATTQADLPNQERGSIGLTSGQLTVQVIE
ncbi:hypothetical protein [Acaryochloris sp. CCMEE 5410]|uniref:hypothetical protein n=1 Tax=Acaryochloris sp. CCMEE 5410 TaxID=310037 RepID=UPI0002484A5E|nr:hypothetical protein [Acaryochloris sp. CCMEE 5410]KAI9129196.1 hypothetical protein ON05_035890 [Acaryochloris sp. CCMEE 5410]